MPTLADRNFRRQYRKKHKLDTRIAFLGDGNNPSRVRVPGRPNYVYVQYPASSSNTSNLGWPTIVKMDVNLQDDAGTPVLVGYDDEGDIAVLKLSSRAIESNGDNPQQNAVNNPVNKWVDLNYSPLLRVEPISPTSLYLAMLGMPYIDKDGTFHDFRGISGGMNTTSLVPGSSGQWRLIAPWLKTDDTHEITASTAKSQADPFTTADVQELVDARSVDSLPTSVWILRYGQTGYADTDRYMDWRGWINIPTATSSSSLPAFGAGVTKTLSSDVASAGSDRHLIIAAESGTADNLIEITGLSVGDEVIIRPDAGDTITVKHNDAGATDKILLYNTTDLPLTGDQTLKLVKTVAGKVVQYVDEKGSSSDLPQSASVLCDELLAYNSSDTPITLNAGTDSGEMLYMICYQSPQNNGDYFELPPLLLKAGTYTCYARGQTTTDRGKLDWTLDGVSQTTGQDWYSGGLTHNVVKSFTLTVATDGIHTLRGTINGKNGSSSNYLFALTKIWIQ